MAVLTLVAQGTHGQMGPVVRNAPNTPNAKTAVIKMQSTVFGLDPTLSIQFMIEESFDSGATWAPASGFPATSTGGTAGTVLKDGSISDGLPSVQYAYDGTARQLRLTAIPLQNGSAATYDYGLTATIT